MQEKAYKQMFFLRIIKLNTANTYFTLYDIYVRSQLDDFFLQLFGILKIKSTMIRIYIFFITNHLSYRL